jgi:hypothetical protein
MKKPSLRIFGFRRSGVEEPAAAGEKTAYTHAETGLSFPGTVGPLVRCAVTSYEEERPGLGVSVVYETPGVNVTVYLYNLGAPALPSDVGSPQTAAEFSEAVRRIFRFGKMGLYSDVSVEEVGTTWIGPEGSRRAARYASFRYAADHLTWHSRLYLLTYRDHFLKIRAACTDPLWRRGGDPAATWLEGFLPLLDDLPRGGLVAEEGSRFRSLTA